MKKLWDHKTVLGRVDVEQIVRAIDNLLMNALKFSFQPGEITVRLTERVIAKNIVELHGGRIGLEHRNGHFTFYFELPCTGRD